MCIRDRLPNRFDAHTVDAVRAEVANQRRHTLGTVTLDGSAIVHIDQAGLDLLTELGRADRSLSIQSPSTALTIAVELTAAHDVAPMLRSTADLTLWAA